MFKVVKSPAGGCRRQKVRCSRTPGAAVAAYIRGLRITTVAARLSGFFLFAALSLSLACGDRDEPESAGVPVGPELAAFKCANFSSLPRYPGEPRPTVAEELCAASGISMGANDVQSALTKLVKAIKTSDYSLVDSFVALKWFGSADDLEHLHDHLVLADDGSVADGAVADKDGDVECLPNGKACASFDSGWSKDDRIWTGTVTDCTTLEAATTLDVYGECLSLQTKNVSGAAGGKFDLPVTLNICSNAPSSVTPTIAKVFETSNDDTLGTNFESIEYFNTSPGVTLPSCATALAMRAAAPPSGGVAVLADQKRAPNGLGLQGSTGSKVSLFSDWGIVDLESALIQGTITKTGSGFAGATVELFCGTGTVADMTTTSGSGGAYSFDNSPTHIFQVGESCEVSASGPGFGTGSSTLTVQKGLNTVNIAK